MMVRLKWIPVILLSFCLFQCAGWNAYQQSIFDGRMALNQGEYDRARQDFLKAAQANPDARSYAYAATASYKMHDLPEAMRLIKEAEKLDGKTYMILRIRGYKALILLAEGRQKEGLDALRDYLAVYENAYPLPTSRDVERMARSGRVDLPSLEKLLDEQITTYESDLEQYWGTQTGWLGQRTSATAATGGGFP